MIENEFAIYWTPVIAVKTFRKLEHHFLCIHFHWQYILDSIWMVNKVLCRGGMKSYFKACVLSIARGLPDINQAESHQVHSTEITVLKIYILTKYTLTHHLKKFIRWNMYTYDCKLLFMYKPDHIEYDFMICSA